MFEKGKAITALGLFVALLLCLVFNACHPDEIIGSDSPEKDQALFQKSLTENNAQKVDWLNNDGSTKMETPYMNDFLMYMEESYPNEEYELTAIEINEEAGSPTYSYLYEMYNGNSGDVLFAVADKKKWTVDCNGSCGCRSQFIASDPPKASCSCEDCTLVATSTSQSPGDK